MRYTIFAAFTVSLVVGFGCAVTDYQVITDNDQTLARGSGGGAIVDTRGKVRVIECSQAATIWPDGTDELFTFTDQQADGTAMLTTYTNFSTGREPTFLSDFYCNGDWTGCAVFTAPDDNDGNLFDGRFNANCSGARSLSLLYATARYYGECGEHRARLRVGDKLRLLGSAVEAKAFGRAGLLWTLDGSNTEIHVRNLETGRVVQLPDYGVAVDYFLANGGRNSAAVWLDHAMLGPALRDIANRLDNELRGDGLEVTLTYNGVATTFHVAGGAHPDVNAGVWRKRANRSF